MFESINPWTSLIRFENLIGSHSDSAPEVDPYILAIFNQMKETPPPSKTLTYIRVTNDARKLQKQAEKIVTEFKDCQFNKVAMTDFWTIFQENTFHFPLFKAVLGQIDNFFPFSDLEEKTTKKREICIHLVKHMGTENSSAVLHELIGQETSKQKSKIPFADSTSPAMIFLEALIEIDIPALAQVLTFDATQPLNLELFAIALNKMDRALDAYQDLDDDAPDGVEDLYAKIKQELQHLTLKKKRGFCALLVQRLGSEKSIELFHELIGYEIKKQARYTNQYSPACLIMGALIDTDIPALVKAIVPYISKTSGHELLMAVFKKMDAMQKEDGLKEEGDAPQSESEKELDKIKRQELAKKFDEIKKQELDDLYLSKKQLLCQKMASALGPKESLKLFKGLITCETRNSTPQTLFNDYFTPSFLFMKSLLNLIMPQLSRQIAAYLEAFHEHGIPQATWSDEKSEYVDMQKAIAQSMLKSLIENLAVWTQTVPPEVVELNQHLITTGLEVYKNKPIPLSTTLKFAYLPFFEVFFFPLFKQLFLQNTTIPLTQKLACDTVLPEFKRYIYNHPKDMDYIDHQVVMDIVSRITGHTAL